MVYQLKSENLTHLGGHMGSEYTYDNWGKFFSTIEYAKEYAEKDYVSHFKERKPEYKIKWEEDKSGLHTQDLSFVMYHIEPVKVER